METGQVKLYIFKNEIQPFKNKEYYVNQLLVLNKQTVLGGRYFKKNIAKGDISWWYITEFLWAPIDWNKISPKMFGSYVPKTYTFTLNITQGWCFGSSGLNVTLMYNHNITTELNILAVLLADSNFLMMSSCTGSKFYNLWSLDCFVLEESVLILHFLWSLVLLILYKKKIDSIQ